MAEAKSDWRCKRCNRDPYWEGCGGNPLTEEACPLEYVGEFVPTDCSQAINWRLTVGVFLLVAVIAAVLA